MASGAGRAAIAIVRLSGPHTRAALLRLFGSVPEPRRAVLGSLRDGDGPVLDRGLLLWFPAPASFTGEDCAEMHLHGGRAVVAGVLAALAAQPGCRPAEPGEFTRRAFLNGKLDLTAVESLADLIEADTAAQRDQALRQLEGPLGAMARHWRSRLLEARALVESEIDFADEADVGTLSLLSLRGDLLTVQHEIEALLAREGQRGERLRDGFHVVIAGPPNAGKSSLLNALAARDVAIVSPQPGTTRDALEVHLELEGLPIVLVDTAGLRESADSVERDGMQRARDRAATADLVLWLGGVDEPFSDPPPVEAPIWRIRTKLDLVVGVADSEPDGISVKTGAGLETLLDRIAALAREQLVGAEPGVVTRARHRDALGRTVAALEAIRSTPGGMIELVAEDLRLATRELGRIIGEVDVEDVLGEIFSRFCIGK